MRCVRCGSPLLAKISSCFVAAKSSYKEQQLASRFRFCEIATRPWAAGQATLKAQIRAWARFMDGRMTTANTGNFDTQEDDVPGVPAILERGLLAYENAEFLNS